jgi:hypothetical protein
MNRISKLISLFTLLFAALAPSSAMAGGSISPTDPGLEKILFDGKEINETLAESLATGTLINWASCSSTEFQASYYGLVESGGCIVLEIGDIDRYTGYVLSDTRCYRSSSTCYAGYRLYGVYETEVAFEPGYTQLVTEGYRVRRSMRGYQTRYQGRMLKWFDQTRSGYQSGWASYDASGIEVDGGTYTAMALDGDCGMSDAEDEDDCEDVADCTRDKCETLAAEAGALYGIVWGVVGCAAGVAITVETGPGMVVGCAAGAGILGGGLGKFGQSHHELDCPEIALDAKRECEERLGTGDDPDSPTDDEPKTEPGWF